jgi:modulator of FtsH protease HflK
MKERRDMKWNLNDPAGRRIPFPSTGKGLLPLALGAALVLAILVGSMSSFYTVQPEERAVVKRFGRVIRTTDPGLRFKLPFGIDQAQRVATERVLKEEFGFRTGDTQQGRTRYSEKSNDDESMMLTGDLNIIDVEWVVQYRIRDPIQFLYRLRDTTSTLRDISESVMRRVVGNRLGSEVLTVARVDVQQKCREEIQAIMDLYESGLQIITVELQDVVPPARVKPAFNEVNEARQERERTINEAQKQVNQEVPRAEGAALRQIAEAEGYATERVNRALGESARFNAVLVEYKQAPEVTRTRLYLETVGAVWPAVGQLLVVQDGQVGPVPLLNVNPADRKAVQP